MNRATIRKLNKLFKKRRKLQAQSGLKYDRPEKLKKGDMIKIFHKIMLMKYSGELLLKIEPDTIVKYLGRKNNPASNYNNWIHVELEDKTRGLLNPIGMIDCFTFVKNEEEK